jgi:hypothetical protein
VDVHQPKRSAGLQVCQLSVAYRGPSLRNLFGIHSAGEVSKEVQRVAVAAFADRGRWPKPRPDIDHDKDPHRLLLAPDDRSDLVRLKFSSGGPSHFSITETTTPAGCSF